MTVSNSHKPAYLPSGTMTGIIRVLVTYRDTSAVAIGGVPAGAVVNAGEIVVLEAFNAGTDNLMDVGTDASSPELATGQSVAAKGIQPLNGLASAGEDETSPLVDTTVYALYKPTGTPATQGRAEVIVRYAL